MLRAVPKSPFSWSFHISDGDRRVAELECAWLGQWGQLRIADAIFQLQRQHCWSGTFTLLHEGATVACAQKPSVFFRRFWLEYEEQTLVLQALSPFRRTFGLYDGDSLIGTIQPEHWFSRKARINLPEDMPIPVKLFAFWLAALQWRRQAQQHSQQLPG